MWLNAGPSSPIIVFFAALVDLTLYQPFWGDRGGKAAWGLLRVGLGGSLALLPQNPLSTGPHLWKAMLPPGYFHHLLLPMPSPSTLAALLSSIKSFFALADLTFHSASSIWNGRMAQITDSRTLEVRGYKGGENEAWRGHKEYNSSRTIQE